MASVGDSGGDPPEKAATLVLDIIEGDANGRFLWIDDPIQSPIPSWGDSEEVSDPPAPVTMQMARKSYHAFRLGMTHIK